MPPQSQEPEIHLLEKLVNSAVDADKKIESANKGELKENSGKTLEKYTIIYILVTVTSSGILKVKQKLGRTFYSDKLGGIAFTKISKLTMCSA